MKVTMKEVGENVNYYSSKSSEYSHQLGIAGIVVVWVLFTQNKEYTFKILLVISLLLFIAAITTSLIHYYWLARMADKYYHKNAQELRNVKKIVDSVSLENELVEENLLMEKLSWIFFKLKFLTLLIAYVAVIVFVAINFLFK